MAVAKIPKKLCNVKGCTKKQSCKGWCSKHYWRWRRHGDPLAGGTSKGELMRWIKRHASYEDNDCLKWPFGRFTGGYGMIFVGGHSTNAHRVMCRVAHGEPPTSRHHAAHSCGRGKEGCMNPNHIRWDTAKGNHADKVKHGTHNRGIAHPRARLTEEDVRKIRKLRGRVKGRVLAARYNVSPAMISLIHSRKAWPHLE